MFFRNLSLFRFPLTLAKPLADLESALADCRLKPVGPMEPSSRGFVPPMGGDSEALVHGVGAARWLALGGEDRLLPGSVVNAELGKRLAAKEEALGRKPGGKMRRQMKEDLVAERVLLAALGRMPPTSGVALGFDRAMMCLVSASEIREVVSFAADEI